MDAVLFVDSNMNTYADKARAELYMRLYQYAAEDFVAHPDMQNFARDIIKWMQEHDKELQRLSTELTNHVHRIPEHTHAIEPHIHGNGNNGSPTTTNMGAHVTQPTPLTTVQANNSSSFKYQPPQALQLIKNTTTAPTNLTGNKISGGSTMVGDFETGSTKRRTLVIPKLMQPSIPPYLQVRAS